MHAAPTVSIVLALLVLLHSSLPTLAKPSNVDSSESAASNESCTSPPPTQQMSGAFQTIGILGTGRLGAHTAATWAAAGHRVLLGSRDPEKAREIVRAIRSPSGYRGKGGEQTKALPEGAQVDLEGTDMAGAAAAPIIFVATPFPATEALLLSLRPLLSGKIIIDATNPYYSGSGLPVPGRSEDSAVEFHRNSLADASIKWTVGYKDVMWTKIQPGSSGVTFDTCGDAEAKEVVTQLARSHGFTARDRGGFEAAASLEPGR